MDGNGVINLRSEKRTHPVRKRGSIAASSQILPIPCSASVSPRGDASDRPCALCSHETMHGIGHRVGAVRGHTSASISGRAGNRFPI